MAVFGLLDLLFTALGVMLVYFGVLHLVRTEAITGFYVRNIPGYGLLLGERDTTRLFGYALVIVGTVVVLQQFA